MCAVKKKKNLVRRFLSMRYDELSIPITMGRRRWEFEAGGGGFVGEKGRTGGKKMLV